MLLVLRKGAVSCVRPAAGAGSKVSSAATGANLLLLQSCPPGHSRTSAQSLMTSSSHPICRNPVFDPCPMRLAGQPLPFPLPASAYFSSSAGADNGDGDPPKKAKGPAEADPLAKSSSAPGSDPPAPSDDKSKLQIREDREETENVGEDLGDHTVYYDRNYITEVRAMKDFVLKPEHLKHLRRTSRRSPNERDPPLNVFWRKDIKAKSIEVWGSLENMEIQKEVRDLKASQKDQFNSFLKKLYVESKRKRMKRRLSRAHWPVRTLRPDSQGLDSQSGRVVLWAVVINTLNCAGKGTAWLYTGSHAMFSETIHSLADTLNQLILAYGIKKSVMKPNQEHPYGYSNMQYVSSLISGVGIFFLGSGLSVYHGIVGLVSPDPITSLSLAYLVLAGSFLSESVTLYLAVSSIRDSARQLDMSFLEFVIGGYDPCVNVVLLEDMAAVMGVVVAAGAMGLSAHFASHIPDAIGSLMIGGLLGSVASFMIYSNATALVGRSIPEEKLALINRGLEGDIMVRQVHDVKGIDMGNGVIRYKAEVDVDGRELAKIFLRQNDLHELLDQVHSVRTEAELETLLLQLGEGLVDCLGAEVDRMEKDLKRAHPDVKHVDLEVL